MSKFVLFKSLGYIKVPPEYRHENAVERFKNIFEDQFVYFNPEITDLNHPRASFEMSPGMEFDVDLYQQEDPNSGKISTGLQRLSFMTDIGAYFVGIRGLLLGFDLFPGIFDDPKIWLQSLDIEENLFLNPFGWKITGESSLLTATLTKIPDGRYYLGCEDINSPFRARDLFLVFKLLKDRS
jgi:hypothetical protein